MAMAVMMMWARVGQRRVFADVFVCSCPKGVRDRVRELVKACFVRRRRVFHALYRPADPYVRACGWSEGDVLVVAVSRLSCHSAALTLGAESGRCRMSAVGCEAPLVILSADHLASGSSRLLSLFDHLCLPV